MMALLISLLLFAAPVYAAEVTVTMPDAFIKQKVEQICNMKKSVKCEGKSDGQIIKETIEVVFRKIGYKTNFSDIDVTVEYGDVPKDCTKTYDGCNTCIVCGGMSSCTTIFCDYTSEDYILNLGGIDE